MKTVDVLFRIDRFQDLTVIDLRRKRKLNKNPVDIIAFVQRPHQLEQLRMFDRGRKMVVYGGKAEFFGGFDLVSDVDRGCRIIAHPNDGQARHKPVDLAEVNDLSPNFGLDGVGYLFSTEYFRCNMRKIRFYSKLFRIVSSVWQKTNHGGSRTVSYSH